LNNEIVVLDSIECNGFRCWQAEGKLDGELMRVTLYPEHKRAICQAGHKLAWGKSVMDITEPIYAALAEHNGRRRIAFVLKRGTEDEWIEVKQK
jgi:hypothetical protein